MTNWDSGTGSNPLSGMKFVGTRFRSGQAVRVTRSALVLGEFECILPDFFPWPRLPEPTICAYSPQRSRNEFRHQSVGLQLRGIGCFLPLRLHCSSRRTSLPHLSPITPLTVSPLSIGWQIAWASTRENPIDSRKSCSGLDTCTRSLSFVENLCSVG